ncbi:UDP-glucose dehydrogenase family protein [Chloroflexota bacterium]
MKISVIGAGYVGLITAVCFAKLGNEVQLIDVHEDKVKSLNDKICPIYEEGLDELLHDVHMEITSDYCKIEEPEAIFICVGTPSNEDGSISLEQITEAAEQIKEVLKPIKGYCIVVVKSTVPPGTTDSLIIPILEGSGRRAGKDFGVCMSPEFLREGKAVYDFMNPSRLIIGELDKKSGDTLLNLYHSFNTPILRTNLRTAEMTKLASNAFLATKISFINEIGNVCKALDIDIYDVAKGMGLDDRIGGKFLNAGLGFGGSCLPKDLSALTSKAKDVGCELRMLEEVFNLNERQGLKAVELLRKHISLKGACIGLLGLAFKPETDDVRDSRAIGIVKALLQEGAIVKAYDPLAMENFKKLFPQIEYVTKRDVLDCDAVVIITEWKEFNELDYTGKIVIDGRRIPKAREAMIYEGVCW